MQRELLDLQRQSLGMQCSIKTWGPAPILYRVGKSTQTKLRVPNHLRHATLEDLQQVVLPIPMHDFPTCIPHCQMPLKICIL